MIDASPVRCRRTGGVLDERSMSLLMTLLEFDQAREQAHANVGIERQGRPKDWRAIEYGPEVSPQVYADPPLRAALRRKGLMTDRVGASWISMEGLGLIVRSEKRVAVSLDGSVTRVGSLFVALTRKGRSLAKGAQPKGRSVPVLSESAWRVLLLASGRGPGAVNTVRAWQEIGFAPPESALIAGVVSGLSKRGLVDVDSWAQVTITGRGAAFVREQMGAHSAAYADSGSWAQTFGVDRVEA